MAEGILRSLLPSEIAGHVRVVSAGTGAHTGAPATPLAIATAAAQGIDIGGHRSAELSAELVSGSDLILGMESQHVARAIELDGGASARTHVITDRGTEGGLNPGGIADPVGAGADTYQDTFHRIRSHLLRWIPVIREEVERRERV
jgi:protein-tyrosine-phosphatase